MMSAECRPRTVVKHFTQTETHFRIPAEPRLVELLKKLRVDMMDVVFTGRGEFGLVTGNGCFTVPAPAALIEAGKGVNSAEAYLEGKTLHVIYTDDMVEEKAARGKAAAA